MALNKEAPEFDVDDELLILEPGVILDEALSEENDAPLPTVKSRHSSSPKQHKYIDYSRALDATQLYLNEIGFSPC